jgi:hypothetical protein
MDLARVSFDAWLLAEPVPVVVNTQKPRFVELHNPTRCLSGHMWSQDSENKAKSQLVFGVKSTN